MVRRSQKGAMVKCSRFKLASIISADRVVFNIKGNDYRLVVAVDFEKSIVWIKWISTVLWRKRHKQFERSPPSPRQRRSQCAEDRRKTLTLSFVRDIICDMLRAGQQRSIRYDILQMEAP